MQGVHLSTHWDAALDVHDRLVDGLHVLPACHAGLEFLASNQRLESVGGVADGLIVLALAVVRGVWVDRLAKRMVEAPAKGVGRAGTARSTLGHDERMLVTQGSIDSLVGKVRVLGRHLADGRVKRCDASAAAVTLKDLEEVLHGELSLLGGGPVKDGPHGLLPLGGHLIEPVQF